MSRKALVTGSSGRTAEVGMALEKAGFLITTVTGSSELEAVCADLGQGSLDCYVQLPVDISTPGATTIERVHGLLQRGLLARFEAARTVLPALARGSAVILVAGNSLTGSELAGNGVDDQQARVALLRVLGHCVSADAADRHTWVSVVDHRRTPAQIADVARERGGARQRMIDEFSRQNSDMSYDDWKLAVLSLTSTEI